MAALRCLPHVDGDADDSRPGCRYLMSHSGERSVRTGPPLDRDKSAVGEAGGYHIGRNTTGEGLLTDVAGRMSCWEHKCARNLVSPCPCSRIYSSPASTVCHRLGYYRINRQGDFSSGNHSTSQADWSNRLIGQTKRNLAFAGHRTVPAHGVAFSVLVNRACYCLRSEEQSYISFRSHATV